MTDYLLVITICFLHLQLIRSSNTWIPYESIEYMYVSHCRNWTDSQSYCQSIGGQLASATTATQRKFIVNYVVDATSPSGSCSTWYGAYLGGEIQGFNVKTAIIKWFDGTITDFQDSNNPIDWDTNEPNNLDRHTLIGFKLSTGLWHTVYPGDQNVQICQRTIISTTTSVPTTYNPTTSVPTTYNPTTAAPTTSAPTTSAPTTLIPTTSGPTTYNPTTSAPTTLVPTTSAPTTSSNTSAPTTLFPTTFAPTTLAPTTYNPTTSIPTTFAPTTSAPTTSSPTTSSPTTFAPTTSSPTTFAPTTSAPTTSIPTTFASATLVPTTSTPTTSTTSTSSTATLTVTMAEQEVMDMMKTTLSKSDAQSMEQGQTVSNLSTDVYVQFIIIGAIAFICCITMTLIIFIFVHARRRKNNTKTAAASPVAAPNMVDNNLFGVMNTNLCIVRTNSEGNINEGVDTETTTTLGGPMPQSYKKHMTKPSTYDKKFPKCTVDTPMTVDSEELYMYEMRDHITKGYPAVCLEIIDDEIENDDDDDDIVINEMTFGQTLPPPPPLDVGLQISPSQNKFNNVLPTQIMVPNDNIKYNEDDMANTPMTAISTVSDMETPICYDMNAIVTLQTPVGVVDTLTAIIQKHKENEEQYTYDYDEHTEEEEDD